VSEALGTQFGRWDERLERLSDRFNPVVVREVRQALKARAFIGVFSCLLICCWAYSVIAVLRYQDSIVYFELGPQFYLVYLLMLIGCLMFAIPSGAFFSMSQEFRDRAFEMLAITALSPSQIVSGKLQGAVVMMMIYGSAIAPFVCLSYMLGGLGLIGVFFSLTGLFLVSISLSMFAVMLGALCQKPWMEVLNLIILLIVAMITSGITYGVLSEFVVQQTAGLGEMFVGAICFGVFLLFVSMISLGVAQAQLTTTFLPIGYRRTIGPSQPVPLNRHPNAAANAASSARTESGEGGRAAGGTSS
jgi:hypothetical protein